MLHDILEVIMPLQVYEILTFFVALFFLKIKSPTSKLLFLILLSTFIAETGAIYLTVQHRSMACLISITTFIHNALWLLILSHFIRQRPFHKVVFIAFVTFGVLNLFFIEGTKVYNFNTFIVGALLYLVTFIFESFYQLKRENLEFFLSNHYIMLFAPVMYLIGMSSVFGFRDTKLPFIHVFGGFELYKLMSYIVNITYYSLVNFYIYRERKMNYGE